MQQSLKMLVSPLSVQNSEFWTNLRCVMLKVENVKVQRLNYKMDWVTCGKDPGQSQQ